MKNEVIVLLMTLTGTSMFATGSVLWLMRATARRLILCLSGLALLLLQMWLMSQHILPRPGDSATLWPYYMVTAAVGLCVPLAVGIALVERRRQHGVS